MKLKEYVEGLTKLMQEKPETAELQVITSRDDEGNGYNPIYYEPSVGHYDRNEFNTENVDSPEENTGETNAVLVN